MKDSDHPTRRAAQSVEHQFQDARRRAARHWFDDGLVELAVGLVFLAVAAYFWLDAAVGPNGAGKRWMSFGLPVILLVAVFAARRLVRRAKERVVYARAGYVAFAERRQRRWLPGLIAGALAATIAMLARRTPGLEAWLPALQGFVIGGVLAGFARTSGLARLLVPGLLIMLAGTVVALLGEASELAAAHVFGASALVLAGSGALALRRFLKEKASREGQ